MNLKDIEISSSFLKLRELRADKKEIMKKNLVTTNLT